MRQNQCYYLKIRLLSIFLNKAITFLRVHPRVAQMAKKCGTFRDQWFSRFFYLVIQENDQKVQNKEKTLSKVPASFVIYVLCFPAFLLLLVSLPFKLICCLSQFVASSKVILFQDNVKVFWYVLYVLPFVGTICLCCILNIKS